MSLFVASLYLLCLAFLFGSALYVYSRDPYERLNSSFTVLALTLLGWVATLFLFNAQTNYPGLIWLGRANFAAAALAAPATLAFVCSLAQRSNFKSWLLRFEIALVGAVSLFTGLVDQSETVRAGVHITSYGFLFPLYVLHILGFVGAALWFSFRPSSRRSTLVTL